MALGTMEDRVAVLLKLLGDEVAAPVLARLPKNQADQIRTRLSNTDAKIPREVVDSILEDFERFLRIAMPDDGTKPKPDPEPEDDGIPKPQPALFDPTDDPVADLNKLAPFQIAGALQDEQPRTVGVVLNQLKPVQAAQVLEMLDDELQNAAFLHMNAGAGGSPFLVRQIIRTTVSKGLAVTTTAPAATDADERIAETLRSVDRDVRSRMFNALQESDPSAAMRIQMLLYQFEDLGRIDDRSMQKILADVETRTLAEALKGADEAIVNKVMGNLAKRARATLAEEMELGGSISGDAVDMARLGITQALATLDQAGEVQFEGDE